MVENRPSRMQNDSTSTSSRPILEGNNLQLPTATTTITTATATNIAVANTPMSAKSVIILGQVKMLRAMERRLQDVVPRIVAESLRSHCRTSGNQQAALQHPLADFLKQMPPLLRCPQPKVLSQPLLPRDNLNTPLPQSINHYQPSIQSHSYYNLILLLAPSTVQSNLMLDHSTGNSRWIQICKEDQGRIFIFRVEEKRKDYGWSEVLWLLSGEVLEWYWMQRHLQPIQTIPGLYGLHKKSSNKPIQTIQQRCEKLSANYGSSTTVPRIFYWWYNAVL